MRLYSQSVVPSGRQLYNLDCISFFSALHLHTWCCGIAQVGIESVELCPIGSCHLSSIDVNDRCQAYVLYDK